MGHFKRIFTNRPLLWACELSAGLLIALSLANAAFSAPETPAATAIPGLIIPLPAECQVEPLPMEYSEAYVQDPSGAVTPPATAGLPAGTPEAFITNMVIPTIGASTETPGSVDSVTSDALTATVYDYLACFNANDYRRMWSLFSARYLAQSLNGDEVDVRDADLSVLENPPPPRQEGGFVGFIPSDEITVDANGRLSMTVQLVAQLHPNNPDAVPIYFVFDRGRYRIDQLG